MVKAVSTSIGVVGLASYGVWRARKEIRNKYYGGDWNKPSPHRIMSSNMGTL